MKHASKKLNLLLSIFIALALIFPPALVKADDPAAQPENSVAANSDEINSPASGISVRQHPTIQM